MSRSARPWVGPASTPAVSRTRRATTSSRSHRGPAPSRAEEEAAGGAAEGGDDGGGGAPEATSGSVAADQGYLLDEGRGASRAHVGQLRGRRPARAAPDRRRASPRGRRPTTTGWPPTPRPTRHFVCAAGPYGEGATLPAYYDAEEAVLVLRRPRANIQRVDLLTCGTAITAQLRRAPRPPEAPPPPGIFLAYDRLNRSSTEESDTPCQKCATSSSSARGRPATPRRSTPPAPSLQPLVFEGSVTAGGALMNTTEVENFPGFRDGIMGPALMDEMRAQAERFGAELVPDDVVEVDLTGDVKIVKTATDTYQARAVILAMGSGYRKLDLPNEDALSGRGVSLVRDLRRLLLPRAAHRRGRRRRLRRRGGDVPDPVRVQGVDDRAPRRAARLQDHAGARVRRPEARDHLELGGRVHQRRRPAGVGDPQGHRRPARPATSTRPACSSRSATTRARSC